MSSYVFMLLRHSQVCIKLQAVINYRATLYVSAVFAVVRCPSVRPSICPSGTLVYCIHTAEDIIKLLSPPGSPIILVFCPRAPIPNSKGTPSAVAQNTRGGNFFLWFSAEITVYLENVTRYDHGYYGTLTGSRRWRIDTCRCRWPWVTPNPGFKVTRPI